MTKYFFVLFAVLISDNVFSQQQDEAPSKKSSQYIGVQANQLLRQLFNFGGSSPIVTVPYLMTYAVNSTRTGVGLNLGLGYGYNKASTGDAFTPRETTTQNFSFRMGIEKKFTLGKRWFSSYGLDVLYNNFKDRTETTFNVGPGFPSTTTITENKTNGIGIGPRFTLNFHISEKIVLGTEANSYFISSKEMQTSPGQPQSGVVTRPKSFTFTVPAVLYIILKF